MDSSDGIAGSRIGTLADHAARLARDGRLDEAGSWLRMLLSAGDDAELWCLLGKVLAQQGQREAAIAALQNALAAAPGHAGAGAALACLQQTGNPLGAARWRLGAAASVLLLLGAGGWMLAHDAAVQSPPVASTVVAEPPRAAAAPAPLPVAITPSLPVVNPPARLRRIEQYAALAAAVQALDGVAAIGLAPVRDDYRLRVQLRGTAASAHVLERVRAAVEGASELEVDTSALGVDHRYVVRRGDNLHTIARRVYGRTDRWRELWQANRTQLAQAHRLLPGTVLAIP